MSSSYALVIDKKNIFEISFKSLSSLLDFIGADDNLDQYREFLKPFEVFNYNQKDEVFYTVKEIKKSAQVLSQIIEENVESWEKDKEFLDIQLSKAELISTFQNLANTLEQLSDDQKIYPYNY